MSNTSGTIRDTVRETARDVKDAARESGKAASAASDDIQADLQALRDDVTRLATGQEAIDAAQEVRDKVIDAIDESLETRPYTALAMALGIGFLLGAMWRR